MTIFKSSKTAASSFNVKKSPGPDIFNIVEGSKNVSIIGKKLDNDVITFAGKASNYSLSVSYDDVVVRFVNDAGKTVTVKFTIKDLGSVTLAFSDGGLTLDNLQGKGKIAIDGQLIGRKVLPLKSYLEDAGTGEGSLLDPALSTAALDGVNVKPVFTSASTQTVSEDVVLNGQLLATDVDGDKLTFALDKTPALLPAHGIVVVNSNGSYTYTPSLNFSGTDSFVVTVSDGSVTVSQTITVTVAEGDISYSLTAGVDGLTGLGVRNTFKETAAGQFGKDDVVSGGLLDATVVGASSDDTLLLVSDTVTDIQFTNTSGIEVLVMNSTNGTGNDTVTLGGKASAAGILKVETLGGDDRIDVSAVTSAISVDAGTGSDTLVLSGNLDNVALDLQANTVDLDVAVTLSGFESLDASGLQGGSMDVTASNGGSSILASSQADVIAGAAGVDVIRGGQGADTISGGAASDTFVYVGSLTAADNLQYANFNGSVVVDATTTLDISRVVSVADLTTLKLVSDVVAGETLTSAAEDRVVVFGHVDMTLLNGGGPVLGTIVVNSTLRISYNQIISGETFILGGTLGQEQPLSKVIITGLPINATAALDLSLLKLTGIETLVLEGVGGADLGTTVVGLPTAYAGDVKLLVGGMESDAVAGEDFELGGPVEATDEFVFVGTFGDLYLNNDEPDVDDTTITVQDVADNTAITTIRIADLESDLELSVQNNVTTLELLNGDMEADFTLTRVNDTQNNKLTIKTALPSEFNDAEYDVEGDLTLDDEEFITIDTGPSVGDSEIFVSDIEIGDLYASSLQKLTIAGEGDVDIENLHVDSVELTIDTSDIIDGNGSDMEINYFYGDNLQTLTILGDRDVDIDYFYVENSTAITIDASAATGDIDIENMYTDAAVTYLGSSGENDIHTAAGDDTLTIVSDRYGNDIHAEDGADTIAFTGSGFFSNIYAGSGDDDITVSVTAMPSIPEFLPNDSEFNVSIFAGEGDDTIIVTGFAGTSAYSSHVLTQGALGADSITLGTGRDTLLYASGDSNALAGKFDVVTNFDVTKDKLKFADYYGEILAIGESDIAVLKKAASESILLSQLLSNDVSNATIGPLASLYVIGNDSYLFVDANDNNMYDVTANDGTNDVLIKLVGVTNLTADNFVSPPVYSEQFF